MSVEGEEQKEERDDAVHGSLLSVCQMNWSTRKSVCDQVPSDASRWAGGL